MKFNPSPLEYILFIFVCLAIYVFDNQKRRQKIIKNSVTPINTKNDDRQKQRHLCIKNSVTKGWGASLLLLLASQK